MHKEVADADNSGMAGRKLARPYIKKMWELYRRHN
jgi:hypothetical protein